MRTSITALLVFSAMIVASGRVRAQGLILTPGARLIVTGSASITFNNAGLTNNGLLDLDSSTVLMTGDQPALRSFIGGRAPVAFYHLIIDRPAGETHLDNDVAVVGNITMLQGNLQLSTHTLDLGRTGNILGERDEARITGAAGGVIKVSALLNAPQAAEPGNIGLAFTSDASLGWTSITRGHRQAMTAGIRRYFDVTPEQGTTANVAIQFRYLDNELDGMNKDRLALFSGDGQRITSVTTGNSVEGRTTGGLHRFTLAAGDGKLDAGLVTPLCGSFVRVRPNPSPGTFTLTLVSTQEMDKLIRLYDAGGRLLEVKRVHCMAGANPVEWNITARGQGSYFLAVEGASPIPVEIIKP